MCAKSVARAMLALVMMSSTAAAEEPREAPSEYRLTFGAEGASEANAQNMTTIGRVLLRGNELALDAIDPADRDLPWAVIGRLGVLTLVDLPVMSYQLVLGHEIFGHGARMEEFGLEPRYHIDLPLPYSLEADHFVLPSSSQLGGDERVLAVLGGLEAQESAMRHLAFTSFRSGVLRRGEALIYSGNAFTQAAQVFFGGDMRTYRTELSRGQERRETDALIGASMVFAAIDPLLVWSLYASAYRWLVRGDGAVAYPALRIGSVAMSATTRVSFDPWGVVYGLDLLLRSPVGNLDVGIRPGAGPRGASATVEIDVRDVPVVGPLFMGGTLAVWAQPPLARVVPLFPGLVVPIGPIEDFGGGPGAALRLSTEVRVGPWLLGSEFGGKSRGLLRSRPIEASAQFVAFVGARL